MSNKIQRNRQRGYARQAIEASLHTWPCGCKSPKHGGNVVIVCAECQADPMEDNGGQVVEIARTEGGIVARCFATGKRISDGLFRSAAAAQRFAAQLGFAYVTGSAAREPHKIYKIRSEFRPSLAY